MNKKNGRQVWGSRMNAEPSMMNVYYCAGRDPFPRPPADELLIPYDIWVNRVHTLMLNKVNIIDRKTAAGILKALDQIAADYRSGDFHIDKDKEDVHITIESRVAQIAGEKIAGSMHTGRSRNDQTTTDCRLYTRDRLLEFYSRILLLTENILETARGQLKTVMPGFTHYQPAVITTFGHFLLSHASAFLRDLVRMVLTFEQWNISPLGAAAGFGASWDLDREYTAKLLGFSGVQENTTDCITSRWEFEAQIAADVCLFMNHLSILAQDLIIMSMQPRPMIKINDAYVTGSSIMPQKRNPDFAEVTRAKAGSCQGVMLSLFSLSKGALSGYNRDSQWAKYAMIDLFEEIRYAPLIFGEVVSTLKVNKTEMKKRCSEDFITAVDVADYIAQKKDLPFRQAYKIISEAIPECEKKGKLELNIINKRLMQTGKKNSKLRKSEWAKLTSPQQLVNRKDHLGAPAEKTCSKSITKLKRELKTRKAWYEQKQKQQEAAHKELREEIKKIL